MSLPAPPQPVNKAKPLPTNMLLRRTQSDITKAMVSIANDTIGLYESVPRDLVANRRVYEYELSQIVLDYINRGLEGIIDQYLLEGGESNWFMYQSVDNALMSGSNDGIESLIAQTQAVGIDYPVTLQGFMQTAAFIDRSAFVRSRVFEEMQGLSADMKASLGRILGNGMENGNGPRDIAKAIHEEIGLPRWNDGSNKASYARALTIARTEVNLAYRRGRWMVAEDAQNRFDIKTKEIHFSALSPTTRQTHADRHGHIYTVREVRDWYAVDANAINCKCSQAEILVDDNGEPLNKKFVERIQKRGEKFFSSK